jgi:hypothetical protein
MKVKERIREETVNKLTFTIGCTNIKNRVEVGTILESVR